MTCLFRAAAEEYCDERQLPQVVWAELGIFSFEPQGAEHLLQMDIT